MGKFKVYQQMASKVADENVVDASPKDGINPKTGLPLVDEAGVKKGIFLATVVILVLNLVQQGIGFGIAFAIMGMGSADKYKMNIENTKKIVEDGEWMFVAAIILNYTIIWMNNMPGYYK